MKKLIITLAAVAIAACSQAANWKWNNASTGLIFAMGKSTTPLATATAYIFANGDQSDVFSDWANGKSIDSLALASKTVTSGQLAASGENADFSDSTADDAKAYFFVALVDDSGNLFISGTKSGTGSSLKGGTDLTFNFKSKSTAAAITGATAYTTAGWYAAETVPEPTSGILLLLGMAGLALRRRRA